MASCATSHNTNARFSGRKPAKRMTNGIVDHLVRGRHETRQPSSAIGCPFRSAKVTRFGLELFGARQVDQGRITRRRVMPRDCGLRWTIGARYSSWRNGGRKRFYRFLSFAPRPHLRHLADVVTRLANVRLLPKTGRVRRFDLASGFNARTRRCGLRASLSTCRTGVAGNTYDQKATYEGEIKSPCQVYRQAAANLDGRKLPKPGDDRDQKR